MQTSRLEAKRQRERRGRLLNIHVFLPLGNIKMEILHSSNEERFSEKAEPNKQFNRFDEHVAGAEGGY
jgi:hypothetical protein